jgi:hypothetical protein
MSIAEVERAERMAAMMAEYRERKAADRLETLRRTEIRQEKYQWRKAALPPEGKLGTMELTYPAAVQAIYAGHSYAEYVQKTIAEHVSKGHYSEEYAQSATLGEFLAGNDGD